MDRSEIFTGRTGSVLLKGSTPNRRLPNIRNLNQSQSVANISSLSSVVNKSKVRESLSQMGSQKTLTTLPNTKTSIPMHKATRDNVNTSVNKSRQMKVD